MLKLKLPEDFVPPLDEDGEEVEGILFAYEYATEGYSEKAKNNPGKSLYSADGVNWESMGEHGDLCIKAFASEGGASGGGGCDAFGANAVLLGAAALFAALRVRRK